MFLVSFSTSVTKGVRDDVLVTLVLEHLEWGDWRFSIDSCSCGDDDDVGCSCIAFRFLSLGTSILPRDASKSIGMKIDGTMADELPCWLVDCIVLIMFAGMRKANRNTFFVSWVFKKNENVSILWVRQIAMREGSSIVDNTTWVAGLFLIKIEPSK